LIPVLAVGAAFVALLMWVPNPDATAPTTSASTIPSVNDDDRIIPVKPQADVTSKPADSGAASPGETPIDRLSAVFDVGSARRIIFVCDASGSMLNKFSTLRGALTKVFARLSPSQSFNLVFFQEEERGFTAWDRTGLRRATPENTLEAVNFLEDKITPRGGRNPSLALYFALLQQPELVYIVTDGDWADNEAVLKAIHQANRNHKVCVNTIELSSGGDAVTPVTPLLRQIAQENGGHYAYVKEDGD
jgi:hypothetical protein